jgi:SAM-dependent methyltransferase
VGRGTPESALDGAATTDHLSCAFCPAVGSEPVPSILGQLKSDAAPAGKSANRRQCGGPSSRLQSALLSRRGSRVATIQLVVGGDGDLASRGLEGLGGMTRLRLRLGRSRKLRHVRRSVTRQTRGLITTISARDDMFAWASPAGYFLTGRIAVEKIREALADCGLDGSPSRILDLPCGYGRVLRYFRATWPDAEIVAGELMSDAVAFCQRTFSATALQSKEPLWEADIGNNYDLIWSGSLLTHFDEDHWKPILEHFAQALAPRGVLVFSTIGKSGYEILKGSDAYPGITKVIPARYALSEAGADRIVQSIAATGFGYSHYPGRDDDPYGLAMAQPDWAAAQIAASGLTVVRHQEDGWGSQDLWTVTRPLPLH